MTNIRTYKVKIKGNLYNYIIYPNGDFESNCPNFNFELSRQLDFLIKQNNIKNNQTVCLN